jgi:ribosome assembly protein 3
MDEDPSHAEAPLDQSKEATPPESPAVSPKTSQPQAPADADFSALYLRTVTSEFADDLERLRGAKDFKDSSVPVLVEALKQGAGLYSMEEQERLRRAWGKEGV